MDIYSVRFASCQGETAAQKGSRHFNHSRSHLETTQDKQQPVYFASKIDGKMHCNRPVSRSFAGLGSK